MKIRVEDTALRAAAEAGMDEFLLVVVNAFRKEVGEELTAEAMEKLSGEQITLWAYSCAMVVSFNSSIMVMVISSFSILLQRLCVCGD